VFARAYSPVESRGDQRDHLAQADVLARTHETNIERAHGNAASSGKGHTGVALGEAHVQLGKSGATGEDCFVLQMPIL
jgi:hypothetical protein